MGEIASKLCGARGEANCKDLCGTQIHRWLRVRPRAGCGNDRGERSRDG